MTDNKVYIITSGCYSDYSVHGYCTTEVNAKKYCALKNSGEHGRWDQFEYEEIECLDDTATEVDRLYYQFVFRFARHEYKNIWTCVSHEEPMEVVVKTTTCKWRKNKVAGALNGYAEVTVSTETDDAKKAQKIAQDVLYQWIAEQEDMA